MRQLTLKEVCWLAPFVNPFVVAAMSSAFTELHSPFAFKMAFKGCHRLVLNAVGNPGAVPERLLSVCEYDL